MSNLNPFSEQAARIVKEAGARAEMEGLRRKMEQEHKALVDFVLCQEAHRLYMNANGANIPSMAPGDYLYHPLA